MMKKFFFVLAIILTLTLASANATAVATTCEQEANGSSCYIKTMAYMDFVAPAGTNALVYRVYKQYDRCIAYYTGDQLVAEFGHDHHSHGECPLCGYQNEMAVDTPMDDDHVIIVLPED
jgi:hypothetical protein